jgi:peroxiredoxin (alkyl hydroperoxide reductase subunit C)
MKNHIVSVGSTFPEFKKLAVVSLDKDKEFYEISSEDHKNAGQWLVMFWWPKDFTFVCPIHGFSKR